MQIFRRILYTLLILLLSACSGGQPDNQSPTSSDNASDNTQTDGTQTDGSQTDSSGGDNQTDTPAQIEDIACGVSYPLVVASVYQQVSEQASEQPITALNDLDKTNQSVWQATTAQASLIVELETPALVKELLVTWKDLSVAHGLSVSASKDKTQWQSIVGPLTTQSISDISKQIPDLINLSDGAYTAKYIRLELEGDDSFAPSEIHEIQVYGCAQDVTHNIELIDWYLSVPTDTDSNGRSDSIKENTLANGYFDSRFFSLSKDGGLVFTTSVSGFKTSTNTNYVRSELREMLRRGDTDHNTKGVNQNNWVFSSAPQADLDNAGGIDGLLEVDVAVNKVTTTGEAYQIGRVIIGQIHANDDEPIRVYYRKLPNNSKGVIYFAHELAGGDDSYYEIIGSRDNDADNPSDGIALNERFSYSIAVSGHLLTFNLTKADGSEYTQTVDMSQSGYDQGGQYQYFKAGVYNLNNSGDPHDYAQATFYKIDNSHTGYAH